MASIVSSQIVLRNVQIDGRYVIQEQHVDDSGNIYLIDYMADRKIDISAHLATSAAQFNAQFQLEDQEAPTPTQQTIIKLETQIAIDRANLATAEATLAAIEAQSISMQPGVVEVDS